MTKKSSPKLAMPKQSSWDQLLSKLAIFVSIMLIVGGAIGMILVQKDLQESQDLRQQASVDDGQVAVSMDATELSPGQPGTIKFYINTSGVQTDGVQLTFNLVSDTLSTPPVLSIVDTAPLQLAYSEVETTADGYLISAIALPAQLGQPFSSATDLEFAHLTVEPDQVGLITLNFDVENSISTVHASNPPTDELTHIATTDFTVTDTSIQASPSPSASPDASPEVSPSPSATPEVSPSPSPSASPAVSPSPSASPDASPEVSPSPSASPTNVGGTDVATCNESCSSNNDCDVNLRCYSGQCRLVTNVTSESCSAPADQGLSFSCNEYCSNTGECADGLTCNNNRCRNPENVDSATCAALTISQRAESTQSCNQSCTSNNDCAANLRCYQGACRLATNPGSFSCTPATTKTISESVYGSDAKSKGADDGSSDAIDGMDTDDKMMQDDDDMMVLDGNDETMADGDEEGSALDSVRNYFVQNPKLPLTLMGIGLGLIIAILLLSLLKKKKDDDQPPMPPTGPKKDDPMGQYESSLQNKINALKNEQAGQSTAPSSPQPPKPPGQPLSTPPAPPNMNPPTTNPVTNTSSKLDQIKVPQNQPIKNNSGEIFSKPKTSSMLEKLKNKDVTPPRV